MGSTAIATCRTRRPRVSGCTPTAVTLPTSSRDPSGISNPHSGQRTAAVNGPKRSVGTPAIGPRA